jgi:restriction system protein
VASSHWSKSASLVEQAARIPWRFSVAIAALLFVGLRVPGAVPILQWVLPVLFLLLAGLSLLGRPRRIRPREATEATDASAELAPMTWPEFEKLVTGYFRARGFAVNERSPAREDGAVDLWLTKDEEYFMVRNENWRAESVGIEQVRDLYRAMAARHAGGGFVVTCGSFTPDATAFAADKPIELVGRDRLAAEVKAQARDARRNA